jgi:hypothetical protein
MKRVAILGLLLWVLLLTGCATTGPKIKESWKRPNYTAKVRQVYLIGVTQNHKIRKVFEDELARQLAQHGVTGVPSYPDLVISGQVDREALRTRLKAKGTDAVLVARLAGKEQRSAAFSARQAGYGVGTGPINVYYEEDYNSSIEIVAPGPAVENDYSLVNISANLFETESAQAIWSTLTETTVNYDNKEERLREFARSLVNNMQAQGMF